MSVAVITGGAGGMGLATARLMGRTQRVLIADLRADALERASEDLRLSGVEVETLVCDVADRSSVEQLFASAGSLGKVQSVVHTAGLSPSMAAPEMIMRVNGLGTAHVGEAFLSIASSGSCLVNVASSAGHLPPIFPVPTGTYKLAIASPERFVSKLVARCNLAPERLRSGLAYTISKNFVIWYSRQRAAAFGTKGVRIMSVSPGSFDTAMGRLEDVRGAGALAAHAALGRYGSVEEIAVVLAFCASEQPGYLTGTDILVDGGAAAAMTIRDMLAMTRQVKS